MYILNIMRVGVNCGASIRTAFGRICSPIKSSQNIRLLHSSSQFPKPAEFSMLKINTNMIIKRPASTAMADMVERTKVKVPQHDHATVWIFERVSTFILLILLPSAFLYDNEEIESFMVFFTVLHIHWGLEAILVDYVRPSIFGNFIPKLVTPVMLAVTIALLASLLRTVLNGEGLVNQIRQIWHLKLDDPLIIQARIDEKLGNKK